MVDILTVIGLISLVTFALLGYEEGLRNSLDLRAIAAMSIATLGGVSISTTMADLVYLPLQGLRYALSPPQGIEYYTVVNRLSSAQIDELLPDFELTKPASEDLARLRASLRQTASFYRQLGHIAFASGLLTAAIVVISEQGHDSMVLLLRSALMPVTYGGLFNWLLCRPIAYKLDGYLRLMPAHDAS